MIEEINAPRELAEGGVYLIGVYLIGACISQDMHLRGVHLINVSLSGASLTGVHLMGVHHMGRASHGRASHGRASHERASLVGLRLRVRCVDSSQLGAPISDAPYTFDSFLFLQYNLLLWLKNVGLMRCRD